MVLCRLRPLATEELSWLSEAEHRRAAHYHRVVDRERSLLAASLVRRTLAPLLDLAPQDVPVTRQCRCGSTEHGRPLVLAGDWHVSVSHGGHLVAVVAAQGRAVGVDVEEVPAAVDRGVVDLLESAVGDTSSPEAYISGWVRLEAVVKATGEGLARPLGDVLLDSESSTWSIRGGRSGRWADLPVSAGHRGAVAGLGAAPLSVRVARAD